MSQTASSYTHVYDQEILNTNNKHIYLHFQRIYFQLNPLYIAMANIPILITKMSSYQGEYLQDWMWRWHISIKAFDSITEKNDITLIEPYMELLKELTAFDHSETFLMLQYIVCK